MKAEYARIVKDVLDLYQIHAFGIRSGYEATAHKAVISAIERCEAIANKPVRELTNKEIYEVCGWKLSADNLAAIRRVIAAHIAKQSEPDEIPFDQKKLDEGGWEVRVYHSDKQSFIFREDATKVTLVRKT